MSTSCFLQGGFAIVELAAITAEAFVATCGEIISGGGAFADASCDSTIAARVYDATKSAATTPNDANCCKDKPTFVATCGEITDGGGAFADASCDSTGGTRVYDATTSAATTPNDANCCKVDATAAAKANMDKANANAAKAKAVYDAALKVRERRRRLEDAGQRSCALALLLCIISNMG